MFRLLLLSILCVLLPHQSLQIGFVQPLAPLQALFVNSDLPSIYTFNFTLTSGLRKDGLIRFQFANYTTLGNITCLLSLNNASYTEPTCYGVNNSVYIEPKKLFTSKDQISATIFLSQTVPESEGYTELFEVSTVSSNNPDTAIIFDNNPGFGNFVWEPYSSVGRLFLEVENIGTPATANLQGATNNITVYMRFNQDFTAKYSRVLVVLDMPWKFGKIAISSARSPLWNIAIQEGEPTYLYLPTTIRGFNLLNDQVLEIFFNETFETGREFLMTINGIINPLAITQGKIRFYSTEYTSDYVLECFENTVLYTAENNLNIITELASGIPLGGPAQLYKNAEQYLRISFRVDATIPAGATITYTFSIDNTPVSGTLYIAPTLESLDDTGIQYTFGPNSITLTNLNQMKIGSVIALQVKMRFSKVRPDFSTTIGISLNQNIVKHGVSDRIPLVTNAKSIVTFIGDKNNEANVIETGNNVNIQLNLTTSFKVVASNATLYIYASKYITGSDGISCNSLTNMDFPICDVNFEINYTQFVVSTIPNATAINLNFKGLVISKVSTHDQAIYEFYMRLDKDGTGSEVQDLMVFTFVRPPRNQLSGFEQATINNIQSNNMTDYPSFIRMFGTKTALNGLPTASNQNLVLTVYGLITLASYLEVANNEPFPCGGSLNITCTFIKGSSSAVANYPLDWDRVLITLPDAIISSPFNLYIPQFFVNSSAQPYEFTIGTYNKITRRYDNLYLQSQFLPIPGQENTILGNLNITQSLYIDLETQRAGILVPNSIPISMTVNSTVNASANNITLLNGAATVLITAWEFWNSNSYIATIDKPISKKTEDTVVFLKYKTLDPNSGPMNAVIWTLDKGIGYSSTLFQSMDVGMPYSLDIPNYVMYVTDETGNLYTYNSLINTGRDALSSNIITDFNFHCVDMVQNALNTYCTILFTPNAEIDIQSNIEINFSNSFVTISDCSIAYTANNQTIGLDSSLFSCASTLGQVKLSFNLVNRLPADTYNFSFLGLDHRSGSANNLSFTIYDDDFGYIIETATYNYNLELQLGKMLTLDSLDYDFMNLDSISNLAIRFTLPRGMHSNELLEFDIGADLQGNNKNTNRLAIVLQYANDSSIRINLFGALKDQILQIQFNDGFLLPAGSYFVHMNNLRTPSTHSTDQLKIRLRRITDSVFVLENNHTTFTTYPVLKLEASPQVELVRSRFLCAGCLGELVFQIALTQTYVDSYTVLYIHLPSYFLPAITNNITNLDCSFNEDPITCKTDPDYPYRLVISGAPLLLKPGTPFNLTIYGFVVPNPQTSIAYDEDIFIAVTTPAKPNIYAEQTFLSIPALSLIRSGLEAMYLYELSVSNTTIKQRSDYVLRVNTSAAISNDSKVTITFTEDYTNLRFLSQLSCSLNAYVSDVLILRFANTVCSVTGNTVLFKLVKDIPADSSLILTVNKVPNPVQATVVNANEFVIVAFHTDENDIIAISKDSLNSIYEIDFTNPMNTLQANNDKDIVLTRGTYTSDLTVGTLDGYRFIQDVTILSSLAGFTFNPSVINFYVGDISTTFKIGCGQDVKLRTYPMSFALSPETALVNAYGSSFDMRVTVTEDPVLIQVPATITVPINGFSLPYEVIITNLPYSDMQIVIDIDNDYYNGAFSINGDYSSPVLSFTPTNGVGYISFFTTEDIQNFPQPFYVDLVLDGDNYEAYKLSTERIEIIISNSIQAVVPTLSTSIVSVQKTQALFDLTYNTPSMGVFQLSANCIGRSNHDQIKNLLMNNSYSDLEVTSGCYQRYFGRLLDDPKNPYVLNIQGLTPGVTYNLYGYVENQFQQTNDGSISKTTFTTGCNNFSVFPSF